MIAKPEPGQEKKPKLLIADNGPISVLSEIDGALDWLPGDRPGALAAGKAR